MSTVDVALFVGAAVDISVGREVPLSVVVDAESFELSCADAMDLLSLDPTGVAPLFFVDLVDRFSASSRPFSGRAIWEDMIAGSTGAADSAGLPP